MAASTDSMASSDSLVSEIQLDCSKLPHHFMGPSNKPKGKKPSRCSGCCKRFKGNIHSRNCGLCSAVFCQQCTIYRRRVCCVSGTPYDLGVLTNVCEKCFKVKVNFGCQQDHLSEFKRFRKEKLEAGAGKPVCSKMHIGTSIIHKELGRLVEGFAAADNGFLAGLAGIKISEWQKSAAWVEPGDANKCYQCRKKFGMFASKHNCRIGGQVFCMKCIKKEGLIFYQDNREGEPKWGIKGKENGPKARYRSEAYAICASCSDRLEAMMIEQTNLTSEQREFMDSVHKLQQSTSRMQTRVDKWLPEYQQEVEAMSLGLKSIKETKEKLARLHLNLSSTLSAVENNGKHLLMMHQQRQSLVYDQKQKLLTNILIGTEANYNEHANQFHSTNTQLPKQLTREKLCQVQEKVNQESMLYVYANIRKLIVDLQEYTECESALLEDVNKIEFAITEELNPWPDQRMSYNWEEHLREKIGRIDVAQMVKTSDNPDFVKIVIASQCSTIMQQCLSKLEDETLELEFQETKRCLKQAWERLEITLTEFNRSACIASK